MATTSITPTYTFATATGSLPLSQLDSNYTQITTFLNNPNNYANYLAASGTANTYAVTFAAGVAPTSYIAGLTLVIKINIANTGASTINVNSLGAKSITKFGTTALVSGDLVATSIVVLVYDGTQFQLTTTAAAPGGSDTQVQFNNSGAFGGSSSLTWNGTTLSANALSLTTKLPTTSGGTGLGSFTANQVFYASSTSAIAQSSNLTFSGTDLNVYGLTVGRGLGAGSTNTAIGSSALAANTTGTGNTAIGRATLATNTTGSSNTAQGLNALISNLGGSSNTAVGESALLDNNSGSGNTAIGQSALDSNTSGNSNTAVGSNALQASITTSNNTAVGYQAGYSNTTGTPNTVIGYQAGYSVTTNAINAFGYQAGYFITGDNNSAFGYRALYGASGSSGSSNSAFGKNTLLSLTSGAFNVAIGGEALSSNTTASNNTAVGFQAGASVTTNGPITALGFRAGKAYDAADDWGSVFVGYSAGIVTTGKDNVAVGGSALFGNTSGASNTAIGAAALYTNTTASNNTAVGHQALYSCTTTGAGNTAVGKSSGYATTSGFNNVFVGLNAGNNLTLGARNIFVGFGSQASGAAVADEIVIGTNSPTGKGANTGFITPNGGACYQGNNSASWSTTSDFRLKKNIVDNTEGLDKIVQIRVRNFEYRLPEEVTELDPECAIPKTGVQLGVIAQELREVFPDCVKEETTGVISVDSDNIFWHMINAIKDLKAIVDAQAVEIAKLKAR